MFNITILGKLLRRSGKRPVLSGIRLTALNMNIFFQDYLSVLLITPELANEYLAGAVLLGAAPCTAMVFVWSTLTKGKPAYTVVQVATNDLIILIAFVPIVKFLLGVSNVTAFPVRSPQTWSQVGAL